MASLVASNLAAAAKYKNPVAVFVGGTSGIGQGMAESLNRQTKGNAHIVLVGRNKEAAESIISKMKAANEGPSAGSYEFVHCDVSSLPNIKPAAATIVSKYPKVNFLVLTAGYLSPTTSKTADGLDKKMVMHYWSRWSFIHELLPSLRSAKEAGEDVKVLSVYAAGVAGSGDAAAVGNDLMIEEYATRNPGMIFAHAAPGAVRTNILNSSDSLMVRGMGRVLPLFASLFTVSQDECAEYLWSGLHRSTGSTGSGNIPGAHRLGRKGQDLGMAGYYGTPEKRKKVWEETLKVTDTTEA
ncbi:NAD(P)-binding protein [Dentipellis sp. KUC8613]|nr:NAD(P)-binding protein [Dentipellis sp. KUC8613]